MAKKKAATVEASGSAAERLDALFEFQATAKGISKLATHEYEAGRAVVEADPAMRGAIVREIGARLESGDFRERTARSRSRPARPSKS